MSIKHFLRLLACISLVLLGLSLDARSESCQMSSEIDPAVKDALKSSAQRSFGYVASANVTSLAQSAIPDIANNSEGLSNLLEANAKDLAGATATPRNVFVLDATGVAPVIENAQFYCGVFNPSSDNKMGFTLQNLPAGKYGLVIMDVQGAKAPYFYSFLFKQDASAWKLAALFPRPRQIAGRDAQWYWQQARDFKSKGQTHNAWLHYLVARELAAPVPFVATTKLDAFHEEIQQAQPPDLPEQNPVALNGANGKTYNMTNLFVVPDERGQGLDLVMKYQSPDISDTGKTFIENKEAMKALLARYPELREPFGNVVARAVAPSGQDFGSMLPMKDVK